MQNIIHLQTKQGYEIFKRCLNQFNILVISEEMTEEGVYEFNLMMGSVAAYYYLGKFVGIEESREMAQDVFRKLKL